jgi:hypothetical protein
LHLSIYAQCESRNGSLGLRYPAFLVSEADICIRAPVRDTLIVRMRDFVSSMLTAGVSCNWPYTLDECFETDEVTGQRKLTKVFEEYVSDFDHWTVGSQFLDTFPELEGKVHIKEPDWLN